MSDRDRFEYASRKLRRERKRKRAWASRWVDSPILRELEGLEKRVLLYDHTGVD